MFVWLLRVYKPTMDGILLLAFSGLNRDQKLCSPLAHTQPPLRAALPAPTWVARLLPWLKGPQRWDRLPFCFWRSKSHHLGVKVPNARTLTPGYIARAQGWSWWSFQQQFTFIKQVFN